MAEICRLDSDDCLSLDSISHAFRCGIKEEHSWALIYQSIISLEKYLNKNDGNYSLSKTNKLFIRSNGTIHHKSWHCSSGVSSNADLSQIIPFIAISVYSALDYGTSKDEEIVFPSDLEHIFNLMSETNNGDTDEGIEETDDSKLISVLKEVEERCAARVMDSFNVGEHYRHVCRALVAEAIEMSTFLNQISKGTKELKKIKNVTNEEVDELQVELWAHLWMKVMRQLRTGVFLKRVDKKEFLSNKQKEYELTPFEMLLDDISSRRYSLKKVSLPKQVEKDARTTILEFIRSRPPLKPASERVLGPLPSIEPSLHQKLMDGIKQTPKLNPTPIPFERKFDSCHFPRGKRYSTFSIYTKSVAFDRSVSPVRQRPSSTIPTNDSFFHRLSFRNLSLRRTVSTFNVNKSPEVQKEKDIPTPIPSISKAPFWRRLFNW